MNFEINKKMKIIESYLIYNVNKFYIKFWKKIYLIWNKINFIKF